MISPPPAIAYTISNRNVIDRDALAEVSRLELLAAPFGDTAITTFASEPIYHLADLQGLGAEIWQGVDPLAYINELRNEWDAD